MLVSFAYFVAYL